MRTLACLVAMTAVTTCASAQTPGVPIYKESREHRQYADLTNTVRMLCDTGKAVKADTVRQQLRRSSCSLDLPAPNTTKLAPREVWARARAGYVRVGWFFLCTTCDRWRLNLAGGYVLTANGAVATAYHIVEPPRDLREGWLVAADDSDRVYPVLEVLAANRYGDTCIIRIEGSGFKPLPLSTNANPGDTVFCFSDPLGRRGYFSQGIVNRFFKLPERRLPHEPGAPFFLPTRINVSADWSLGSSGAPVLDEFGNVLGQVCMISVDGDGDGASADPPRTATPATIVFHEAVSARDVIGLVKRRWPP
jgi:hypothetical protein